MYLILRICWLFSKVWFRCFSRHSKFFSVSLDFCPILRCLCSAFNLTEGKQFSQLLLHSCQFWYQRGLGVAVLWGMTPTISKWWQGKFRNAERSKDILAVFPLAKIRNQSAGISEMSASCYNQNTFFFFLLRMLKIRYLTSNEIWKNFFTRASVTMLSQIRLINQKKCFMPECNNFRFVGRLAMGCTNLESFCSLRYVSRFWSQI